MTTLEDVKAEVAAALQSNISEHDRKYLMSAQYYLNHNVFTAATNAFESLNNQRLISIKARYYVSQRA